MADNNNSEQRIDPELARRLHELRTVPPRRPEAAASGRAKFITEVDGIVKEQGFSHHNQFTGGNRFYQRWKEKWNMASPRFRTVFNLVAAIVLVAVFLFGGAGITAYAAQSALPGDALYSVKTGVEQTRVSLAGDAADRAQLSLAFAERRLDEIARLIANGRYSDIAQAVQEYEQYVQKAIAELGTVAAGDAARAQQLTAQVAVLLKRYAETLTGMVNALPETARSEVERAIQVSNDAGSTHEEIEFVGMVEAITADSWTIAGQTLAVTAASEIKGTIAVGSLVKVEALKDANGSLVLREVELATQEDVNENGNANDADGNENEGNANEGNENEGNENEAGEDEEFTGIVEQIGADFWMIGGQMFAISAGSEIDGSIQVGDLVKVEVVRDANGNLLLREVDLADGDDANENDDDGNLNDNDDDQGEDDQNSNDDNANGNVNANDNGDDDHEANVNGNFNDNSGDDNQNVNDNGNTNDNDSNENDSNDNDSNDNDSNDNGDDDHDENSNESSGGGNDNDNSGVED